MFWCRFNVMLIHFMGSDRVYFVRGYTGLYPWYGDNLITLSICEYSHANGQLVIAAKRLK